MVNAKMERVYVRKDGMGSIVQSRDALEGKKKFFF